MTRINTNVASLRGLRSLNKANSLLDTSLTRLSTGLKINSGKDNPAGLIAGETLRSQITAIEQSIKNSSRANNVIATADAALGEVNNLLNQVRGLVQESLNNGALSQSEIEANQNQIDAALDAVNRISANTTFAGDKLIDGSKAFVTQISSTEAAKLSDFQINTALFNNSSTIEVEAEITQAAEKAEVRYVGGSLNEASTIEVAGSKGSQVVFLGSSSSKSDIRDAINNIQDVTGVKASFTAGATFELGATQGFTDLNTNGIQGALAVSGNAVEGALSVSVGVGVSLDLTAASAGATSTVGNITIAFTSATTAASTASISTSAGGSAITVELSGSAGGIDATLADVVSALGATTSLTDVVAATNTGSTATVIGSVLSATALSGGVDAGTITFTADDAGDSNISVVYSTAASAASTTASVATSAGGSVITVALANAGGSAGGITATLTDIQSAINAVTAAADLVDATVTNGGSLAGALSSTALSGGQDAGFIKISDNRNSGSGGSNLTQGGEVFVQVADFASGTTTAALGVNSFNVDAETGNITIQIQLGKDSSGVTSTISDVSSFINTSTTTVTVDGATTSLDTYISASVDNVSSTGSTKLSASGSVAQLLGGSDGNNNDIIFNDARAYGTAGNVQVRFADPGTASQALSVTVTDVSGSDDKNVVFTLATDANGNVTSTADDIKNLLEVSSDSGAITARELVSIEVEGDGSEIVSAAVAATTTDFTTVDIASRILKLESSDYGSDEFVQVNVLAGSFDTKATDNVSNASRDTGLDLQAVINGQQASTRGLRASIRTATLEASLSFNESNNVTGRRAGLTVTGGGSLFQIGQEVSAAGQIGLGIEAVNTARLGGISGKLYELGTGGGKSLLDVGPDTPGSDLVNIVEEAINRVSNLRGRLGAIQKNVIETNITSLGVALENISDARSVIVDTDFAESTAELTKAQILNQAGISVLSIANQNPQQVLSLLG